MNLRSIIILAAIPMALVLQGCGILGIHPKNTVKAEADFWETIPIGTSFEKATDVARTRGLDTFFGLESVSSNKRLFYFGCLFTTPDEDTLALYRQWPKGILLNINDDDMYCRVGVCDNAGNSVSEVDVFFDRNHGFKGYYAFSDALYSKDDRTRYQKEKQQFYELSLDKIAILAHKWDRLAESGNDVRNELPSLPLSIWMQTNLPALQAK